MSLNEQRQATQPGLRYSSKLMTALNRFTGGLATEVTNPLKVKYGKAYDYLISGDTHRYREEIDTAIAQYRLALKQRQDFTEAYVGIAKCLRRKGDSLGAIQYLDQALSQNGFRKELHQDIAKCYAECGYTAKAIYHYERAIKLDRQSVEARFGLALVVEMTEDFDYTVRLYEQIIAIEPEFLPAYNNLGSIFMRLGRYDEAEALFNTLITKAPDFTRGHLGLAITLDKAGKRQQAIDSYTQVLRLRPSGKNSEFIEKRIINLNAELGRVKSSKNTTLVRIK
ncbi:tetratricopeptide repeat protein [Vampirovibrio chlorellavorus]|uniref:tetratricopeptide repeat protein n=1 Tax=Vampirovibrio chlorellavorus TaxID=758823 RepID=UPI0026F2CC32|nr:tetratricopeptide repeat protein [Vampirovibrio chlorellavorus]